MIAPILQKGKLRHKDAQRVARGGQPRLLGFESEGSQSPDPGLLWSQYRPEMLRLSRDPLELQVFGAGRNLPKSPPQVLPFTWEERELHPSTPRARD